MQDIILNLKSFTNKKSFNVQRREGGVQQGYLNHKLFGLKFQSYYFSEINCVHCNETTHSDVLAHSCLVNSLMCHQCSTTRLENCFQNQESYECKGYEDMCFTLTTRRSNDKYGYRKGCADGRENCEALCQWHWSLNEECMVIYPTFPFKYQRPYKEAYVVPFLVGMFYFISNQIKSKQIKYIS